MRPEELPALYEALRATPPFRNWKLPPSESVRFSATLRRGEYGECVVEGIGKNTRHHISLSAHKCETLSDKLQTMAHEMIHLRQALMGHEMTHGPIFASMARQIARHTGWKVDEI